MNIELTAHAIERYVERYAPTMPFKEAEAKVRELTAHMTKCSHEAVIIATGEAWQARDGTIFICKRDKKYRTGNLVVVTVWNPEESTKRTSKLTGGAIPDDVDEDEVIAAYNRAHQSASIADAQATMHRFNDGYNIGRLNLEKHARVLSLPCPPTRRNDPAPGIYISIEGETSEANDKRFSAYGLLLQWKNGHLGRGPESDAAAFEKVRVAAQAAAEMLGVPMPERAPKFKREK